MPELTIVPDPYDREELIATLTRAACFKLKAAIRSAADGSLDLASKRIREADHLCQCALEAREEN